MLICSRYLRNSVVGAYVECHVPAHTRSEHIRAKHLITRAGHEINSGTTCDGAVSQEPMPARTNPRRAWWRRRPLGQDIPKTYSR